MSTHLPITFAAIAMILGSIGQAANAELNHQTAFKQFGEFMNGTWTPAEQEDAYGPTEHVYTWTLDGKFLRTNGTQDAERSWDGFCGIQPSSGKLAWWGFWADGDAGLIYLTEASESRWTFKGDNLGPNGKTTRHVTIEKIGDSRLRGTVIHVVEGKESKDLDQEWVRRAAENVEPPHDWQYLRGDWEFSNSKGITAKVSFEDVAGGMGSVGHWITSDGKRAHETAGWNSDKQALIITGYGQSGNYWHVEYTQVGRSKCSGPSIVNYPDGTSVRGILTIEKINENLVKLQTVGKDQDGKDVTVDAQFQRRSE